ncbi:MAG TPA: hypothetical protein VIL69_12360, partial [Roseomonas sp.]
MDGLYFLAMLIGIAWLGFWSVRPETRGRETGWWLFDMREPETAASAENRADVPRRGRGRA